MNRTTDIQPSIWRACAIGQPGTVEAEKVLQWATYAVEKTPNDLFPNYVLSLAQYRAGRYEDLINGLSPIIKTRPLVETNDQSPQVAIVLAMAHHRLGLADDAQEWLKTAKRAIEKFQPKKADELVDHMPPMNWINAQVLLQEAESLLNSPAAVEDDAGTDANR